MKRKKETKKFYLNDSSRISFDSASENIIEEEDNENMICSLFKGEVREYVKSNSIFGYKRVGLCLIMDDPKPDSTSVFICPIYFAKSKRKGMRFLSSDNYTIDGEEIKAAVEEMRYIDIDAFIDKDVNKKPYLLIKNDWIIFLLKVFERRIRKIISDNTKVENKKLKLFTC